MSSTTISTDGSTAYLGIHVVSVLPPDVTDFTSVTLTAPSLTGAVVDVAIGALANYSITGSADSNLTVNAGVLVLSTLNIDTNGTNVLFNETAAVSAGVLSGLSVTIDNGGAFTESAAFIDTTLLSAAHIGFGTGGGTFDLGATSGSLIALDLLDTTAPITGVASGDVINDQALGSSAISGYSITSSGGNETIVVDTSGASSLTFAVAGTPFTTGFYAPNTGPINMASDGTGGTDLTLCFLAGTMIATPDGQAAIETLQAGDLVLTAAGRAVPVRWIGINTVATRFASALRNMPVRISAGALGDGLPRRDLLVSPDHALLLDNVLVQAGALVNSISITREMNMPAVFRYYHIETAAHDLILAEGVPAETFVDNVSRMAFDNREEFMAICAGEPPTGEMDYPRAKSFRQVPSALHQRLAAAARAKPAAA